MIANVRAISLVAALAMLGACGFKPIYAASTGVTAAFSSIAVNANDGRAAYLVRQATIEALGGEAGAAADYRLDLIIREQRGGFGIRVDDVATRFEIALNVDYRLVRQADGQEMRRGAVFGAASFDVVNDAYADIAAEENAKERAAVLAADRLQRELGLHFANDASG